MKYPSGILEEELKNKVGSDFFSVYDSTQILGRVDFSVCVKDNTPSLFDNEYLIWGEAKRGRIRDFKTSFVQLILTIGKERTFDRYLPPRFLCEFDAAQIAFIPYDKIFEVFYKNDFNWNVKPSDHETREFHELYESVSETLDSSSFIYDFDRDEAILRKFIKDNLKCSTEEVRRNKITKNNFISVYNRWLDEVKPTIAVQWEQLKRGGILDVDFYFADIMSKNDLPIMDKLNVLLMDNHYTLNRRIDEMGLFTQSTATFTDDGLAHARFWLKYERPPKKEYHEYILTRRGLLVPQDVRERKGSYFTPRKWVELSQQYLTDVLGENWQDEYYVWDCCGGTGNLEVGLTNKYNVYVSTLDKSDVDVMHERIEKGANLLHEHVFQFDFLNDGFKETSGGLVDDLCDCEKLPASLREILNDPEKRSRLILLENPPYAEAGDAKQKSGTGKNKGGVAILTRTYQMYSGIIKKASQELFAQFIIRQNRAMRGAWIAEFSKLKILQAQNFVDFRNAFHADLVKSFVVPADTFDNVKGKFPIGFFIWSTQTKREIHIENCDVYDAHGNFMEVKNIHCFENNDKALTSWLSSYRDRIGERIGDINQGRNDFQNQAYCYIKNDVPDLSHRVGITRKNLIECAIYYAARKAIPATWLNDREQFYAPDDSWRSDDDFIGDCLAFTLFNTNISISDGPNHWIPFSEEEVGARERFSSHFMYDFIHGRLSASDNGIFSSFEPGTVPMEFSAEANAVLDRGRELWRYYHSKPDANPDASFYDIRGHFQGFENGKMNAASDDERYTSLMSDLRSAMKILATKIEPRIYEYGFLKK